jgi:hypothetical protein
MVEAPGEPRHLYHSSTFIYSNDLYCFLNPGDSVWEWSWTIIPPDSSLITGTAQLTLAGCEGSWRLECPPELPNAALTASGLLHLIPSQPQVWHTLEVFWDPVVPTVLLPLPRHAIQSPHYADLLHLVQELTTPKFSQIVTHWPQSPVPVRPVRAVSGEVDLAACLLEAVQTWNRGEVDSLLRWSPRADWGIRLAHLPGTILRPPLSTKIVRLNEEGQPLRVHVLAGDNYDQYQDRAYAVRGMVHELAHALGLWGHSQDRHHVLWGRAPPLTNQPSQDERLALRLLMLLPPGLDLSQYGRLAEMDPER